VTGPPSQVEAKALIERFSVEDGDLPIVLCPGGQLLLNPGDVQLARCIGLVRPIDPGRTFDVAVIGAGPAGLATAVYAGSEGLSVLVLDCRSFGGQAGACRIRGHHLTIQRIEIGGRMSKVVIHGDTVYLAGFTANKALAGGVAEQTAEILSIIDGYLAKAGTDKTKLLRATIWLSDIRTVDDMNKVWDAWVPAGCAPARACAEALLQGPEKKVEIQVTAAKY
jgi:enamine deaminase RidA (YjgF/YER057c/UK114 family)